MQVEGGGPEQDWPARVAQLLPGSGLPAHCCFHDTFWPRLRDVDTGNVSGTSHGHSPRSCGRIDQWAGHPSNCATPLPECGVCHTHTQRAPGKARRWPRPPLPHRAFS